MEAQLAASDRQGLEAEVSERARVEVAGVSVADRLRGAKGHKLALVLKGGLRVRGVLVHVGSQWIVVDEGRHQWLVPHDSVVFYEGLGRLAFGEGSNIQKRLGLASALRGLARDRADLTVYFSGGTLPDHALSGVIDRVGTDHFDLAVTIPGEPRRAGNVAAVTTIPFAVMVALRSQRNREA
jgi:hypothetical protein